jgi:NAD(P)-dependent dehydrogenase (short-subunit alcohol dehydrogenase family)
MASRFVAEGAGEAEREVKSLPADSAIPLQANVSMGEGVQAAVARTKDAFGVPDIVVNNAGAKAFA